MNELYFLNPNDYGQCYFVMAEDEDQAVLFVSQSGEFGSEIFKGRTASSLPEKYTIEKKKLGEVIRTENA